MARMASAGSMKQRGIAGGERPPLGRDGGPESGAPAGHRPTSGEALALPAKPPLSGPQRRALVSLAISGADLRALRRSAAGSGFAPAVDELIAELEAALIDPAAFAERAGQVPGGVEAELARLYGE